MGVFLKGFLTQKCAVYSIILLWARTHYIAHALLLAFLPGRFVIVSYNILGVENASNHPELYELVDPKNLEWDRRKKRIRRELKRYDPGILCLQVSFSPLFGQISDFIKFRRWEDFFMIEIVFL